MKTRQRAPDDRKRRSRRRGTLYIAVLGTSMLIGVIGLSSLLAVRAQRRSAMGNRDLAVARLNAQTAIDLGLLSVQSNSSWRTAKPNGQWLDRVALADGSLSLYGIDPTDGNLADSASESVVFTGVGVARDARYILEATYDPLTAPLEALKTCLHTGGNVSVATASTITVSGGPLSANGSVSITGNIVGDVEANSVDRPGRVSGTVTAPAPTKALPATGTFASYQALATGIPYASSIESVVLSRASNPWGTPNADGVYSIDTGGSSMRFRGVRLYGTLVVKCIGASLQIDKEVLFQPYRKDYPVLIVDGNVEFTYDSNSTSLQESDWNTNFNPAGTPYNNVTDGDKSDSYPSEIQGLVYATGTISFQSTAWVRGVVICNGDVSISGTNRIIYDDQPYKTPAPGFTETSKLVLKDGSVRRILTTP